MKVISACSDSDHDYDSGTVHHHIVGSRMLHSTDELLILTPSAAVFLLSFLCRLPTVLTHWQSQMGCVNVHDHIHTHIQRGCVYMHTRTVTEGMCKYVITEGHL